MDQSDAKRQVQQQKPDVKRQTRRLDGNCFYYDITGHRGAKCRQKAGDIENNLHKQTERKPANQQETRQTYNRKLVWQICTYTGHSPKYCRQRQQNAVWTDPY